MGIQTLSATILIATLGVGMSVNHSESRHVLLVEPVGLSGIRASFTATHSGDYELWLMVPLPVGDARAREVISEAIQSVGKEYHGTLELSWWIERHGVQIFERKYIDMIHGTVHVGSGGLGAAPIKAEGIVLDRFELEGGAAYTLAVAPGASFATVLPAAPSLVLEARPRRRTR